MSNPISIFMTNIKNTNWSSWLISARCVCLVTENDILSNADTFNSIMRILLLRGRVWTSAMTIGNSIGYTTMMSWFFFENFLPIGETRKRIRCFSVVFWFAPNRNARKSTTFKRSERCLHCLTQTGISLSTQQIEFNFESMNCFFILL